MSRRERMMDDLDQDIREHLECETQDNIARGMRPAEARRAALLKFGNVTRVTEATREVWSRVWLERLLQDVAYGWRMLRKHPGFTVVAVLTLALGIGASTAVFSVVNGILLKRLPYTDPEKIMMLWWKAPVTSTQAPEINGPGPCGMWRISRRAKNHFNISAHSRAISSIWRAPANRCGWMGCGLAVWAVTRMMSSFLFGVRPTDRSPSRQSPRCCWGWRYWLAICRRAAPPKSIRSSR